MATTKNLARLIAVGSAKQSSIVSFDRHQIPINIDEHLIVKFLSLQQQIYFLLDLDETPTD